MAKKRVNIAQDKTQSVTPNNPDIGYIKAYPKSDGIMYSLDENGDEYPLNYYGKLNDNVVIVNTDATFANATLIKNKELSVLVVTAVNCSAKITDNANVGDRFSIYIKTAGSDSDRQKRLIYIYPPLGGTIEGKAIDEPMILLNGMVLEIVCETPLNWIVLSSRTRLRVANGASASLFGTTQANSVMFNSQACYWDISYPSGVAKLPPGSIAGMYHTFYNDNLYPLKVFPYDGDVFKNKAVNEPVWINVGHKAEFQYARDNNWTHFSSNKVYNKTVNIALSGGNNDYATAVEIIGNLFEVNPTAINQTIKFISSGNELEYYVKVLDGVGSGSINLYPSPSDSIEYNGVVSGVGLPVVLAGVGIYGWRYDGSSSTWKQIQ